jgi:hypothetical protein
MSNGITDLSVLHDKPYSDIKGDWIKVEQEVDNRDPLNPSQDDRTDLVSTETQEGWIAGRGNGTGVYYDSELGEVMTHNIGPAIYLKTARDTVLEVRTDKENNKLLDYKNND